MHTTLCSSSTLVTSTSLVCVPSFVRVTALLGFKLCSSSCFVQVHPYISSRAKHQVYEYLFRLATTHSWGLVPWRWGKKYSIRCVAKNLYQLQTQTHIEAMFAKSFANEVSDAANIVSDLTNAVELESSVFYVFLFLVGTQRSKFYTVESPSRSDSYWRSLLVEEY